MPADLTIVIEGLDGLLDTFERLADTATFFDPVFREWGNETNAQQLYGWPPYAPERPGQTYVRTGRLGQGWWQSGMGQSQVVFTNGVPYAPYVVGDSYGKGQSWWHVGRWWTALDKIEAAIPQLLDQMSDFVVEEIKRS